MCALAIHVVPHLTTTTHTTHIIWNLALQTSPQDLDFDAAVPIYVNRHYLVEYLHSLVFQSSHENKLEDFLYTVLRTTQFVAMARANAVIDLLVSRPLRWLAGKSAVLQDWSPYKMNGVLDLVHATFVKGKDDGTIFLNPQLDIFESIATEQPYFKEFMEYTRIYIQPGCNPVSQYGRTRHMHYKLARMELLEPEDPTNRLSHAKTIEYLQVQCSAALEKMEDAKLAIADKLTSQDGANAVAKMAAAHEGALNVCHPTQPHEPHALTRTECL